MTTDVIIDKRFCGPKGSGNGGYSAGLFASIIDGPAAVMLKAPPPLGQSITLHRTGNSAEAQIDGRVIAVVEPAQVRVDPPALPSDADIAAAHDAFLCDNDGEHLIPFCFVCGDRRETGDGLRLFTGPAPESPINADFWAPGEDLTDESGLVRAEFLWAALDCPTCFSLRLGSRLCLLGRQAVEIHRRPKAGERLIAAAWPVRAEGRKHFADGVLLDGQRNIIAACNALWIEVNDDAMLAQLKADRER